MRPWLVLLVTLGVSGAVGYKALRAAGAFDPVAEVPHRHREYATTTDAMTAILAENPVPRVYAIGEYHQTRDAIAATSPLARFTHEIIGMLEPHAQHLVIESWLDANCWGDKRDPVAAMLNKPNGVSMDVMRLVSRTKKLHMQAHTLPMTCIEYDSVVDFSGHVNFLLLLDLITEKLAETTRGLLRSGDGTSVIVYGGALHNDLYPRWPLETLSYARPLADSMGGHVLEIDLVVPEVVAPMEMIRTEPWFPLLARSSPSRVIVWNRGPGSYVVILPAQSEAAGRVAKLVDPM
ncbi:MAG TPA: hypothetical protein VMZ53_23155 [Kofleriaceae bacterium]|nr:hypothetical protein [Kofleriaceae bacterium]